MIELLHHYITTLLYDFRHVLTHRVSTFLPYPPGPLLVGSRFGTWNFVFIFTFELV